RRVPCGPAARRGGRGAGGLRQRDHRQHPGTAGHGQHHRRPTGHVEAGGWMTTEFTVPQVADTVAAVLPDRELVVHRDRRFTYTDIIARSNRLAAYLHSRGLGCHTERDGLAPHECGQDLLGIYAYNGSEYL